MLKRLIISVTATLVIAAATVATWQILKSTNEAQRARIAESESRLPAPSSSATST